MIKLNISERIATLSILNGFKGNLDTLAIILEDIKQLPINDEEWKKANRKITKVGEGTQWTWDDEKSGEKEINLQKGTIDYIKETIKQKDEKKELTFNDKALISLNSKL